MPKLTAIIAVLLVSGVLIPLSPLTDAVVAEDQPSEFPNNVIGYSEARIVVLPSEDQEQSVDCHGLNRIKAQSLDVKGNSVKEVMDNTIGSIVIKKAVNVGSQVMIEGTLTDDCPVSNYPVVAILEVRDSDGFTTYFAWQNMTMNQHGGVTIGVSWMPVKEGDYVIRLFAYYCPNCLGILGPVATIPVSVTSDK